jgi:hypothetical protein
MQLASLTLTLALMLPTVALAETRYGSFLYDDGLPNSLFLTGEIRQGDSFELRKALRDHEIRIVIMVMSDNHLGRCRQPPWPVGLDGRRACPSGGQPHPPD